MRRRRSAKSFTCSLGWLSTRQRRTSLLAGTALAALVGCGLFTFSTTAGAQVAGVSGGVVVAGQATIANTMPGHLTVTQSTTRGVIDWRTFSIAAGERVDFRQPGANSVTLNRVTGPDPSVVAGRLTANGQLILVNDAGIVFTNGAQINAAGLVASTAGIADPQRFMQGGTVVFDRPSSDPNARVVNAGTITVRDGGLVGLVGNTASNSGVINARLGRVTIGGAETFMVDLAGDGLINFQLGNPVSRQPVDPQGDKRRLASNTGTINADGGTVTLTARAARGVVDNVVNAGGVINARAVRNEGGVVVFGAEDGGTVNVTGTVDVSGAGADQRGGQVVATAANGRVNVAAAARIEASGTRGGGTVLVGGGKQGQGPVANTGNTTVAPGATIRTDATDKGNGGTVIVWADNATVFGGTISAKGGPRGGDGGFAEVSGKAFLDYHGQVDLRASSGATGTLLLDPSDITITTIGSDDVNQTGTDPITITGKSNASILTVATLQNALLTANVVVDAAGGSGTGAGTITVSKNVTSSSGNSLTLNALSTITLNADINIGTGTLAFVSTSGALVGSGGSVTAGAVTLNMGGAVTLTNANNNFGTISGTSGGAITVVNSGSLTIGSAGLGAGAGASLSVTTTGATSSLIVTGTVSGTGVTLVAGSNLTGSGAIDADTGTVSLKAGGSGGINLASTVTGTGLAVQSGNGGVTLSSDDNVFSSFSTIGKIGGAILVTHKGDLTINATDADTNSASFTTNNAGAITLAGTLTATGGVILDAAGALQVNAAINAAGADVTLVGTSIAQTAAGVITATGLATTATAGNITLDQAANAVATFAALATGDIGFRASDELVIGSVGGIDGIGTTGNVRLLAGGTITQTKAVSAAGLAVTATTGDVNLTGATNGIGVLAATATGGGLALIDIDGLIVGSVGGLDGITVSGNVNLQVGGTITQAKAISASGLGVTATAGDIDLTGATNAVTAFAARAITGSVGFVEADGFRISLIGGRDGISASGSVQLKAGGTISQRNVVSAASLGVTTTAGDIDLTGAADGAPNGVATFAASSAGSIELLASDGLSIGSVGPVGMLGMLDGVTAAGNVSLTATGALTVSQAINVTGGDVTLSGTSITQTAAGAITADGLAVTATAGDVDLTLAANSVTAFAASATGSIGFKASSSFVIGSVGGIDGLTGGDITTLISTGGSISQSQAIKTATLDLSTTGSGNVTLINNGNLIDSVVSSSGLGTGTVQIVDKSGGLSVGPITGGGPIAITTSGGALTVAGAITAPDASISLTSIDSTVAVTKTLNAGTTGTLALKSGGTAVIAVDASTAIITAGTLTLETGADGGVIIASAGPGVSHDIGTIATAGLGIGTGGLTVTQYRAAGLAIGPISSAGPVSISENSGALSVGGPVSTTSDSVTLTAATALAINNQISAGNAPVTLTANGGDITQNSSGAITAAGGITMTAATGISLSAGVNADAGTVGLVAQGGDIDAGGAITGKGGITMTASGSIFLDADVNAGSSKLSLTSGTNGVISQSGGIITAGELYLDTTANLTVGDVTIGTSDTNDPLQIAGGSRVAGNLEFNVDDRQVAFLGNGGTTDVGGSVQTSGTLDGNQNLRAAGGVQGSPNVITAGGAGPDFVLTDAALLNTGNSVTIVLFNTVYTPTNAQVGKAAITLSSANNIGGPVTIRTRDPGLDAGTPTNYNLVQGTELINFGTRTITIAAGTTLGNVTLDHAGNTGDPTFVLSGVNGTGVTTIRTQGTLAVSGTAVSLTTNSAALTIAAPGLTVAGAVNVTATGNVSQAVDAPISAASLDLTSATGTVLLRAAVTVAGAFNVAANSNITQTSTAPIAAASLNVTSTAGSVLLEAAVTVTDAVNIQASGTITQTAAAPIAAASLNLTSAAGGVGLGSSVTVTGAVTIVANDGIAQTPAAPITAASLDVTSTAGSVALASAVNDVSTFRASATALGRSVSYRDAGSFAVSGITTNSGVVSLHSENLLGTASGAITQTGGITASGLLVQAPKSGGSVGLLSLGLNNVQTIAGTAAGDFRYFNATSLTVGTVLGVDGVEATAGIVQLVVNSGTLTVSSHVSSATNVGLVSGGSIVVDGNVTAGATGLVEFYALGAVSQSNGVLTGGFLKANTVAAGITLTQTNNIAEGGIVALNASGGSIEFTNANGFVVGTLTGSAPFAPPTTSGITTVAGGSVTLTISGNVTQAGGALISTGTLTIVGTAGADPSVTLTNANVVTSLGTVSLGQGALALVTSGGLTISKAVTASGGISLTAQAGGISINANLDAGLAGAITLDASGSVGQFVPSTITASSVDAKSGSGSVALGSTSNAFATITGSAQLDFSATTTQALTVGTGGVQSKSGAVTLIANGASSDVMIDNAVTANGNMSVTAGGAIAINAGVTSTAGAGIVTFIASGDITDTSRGGISAPGLRPVSTGGSINLSNAAASNKVAAIAGSADGSFTYVDNNTTALTITTISTAGVPSTTTGVTSKTGGVTLQSKGNLTIGAQVTASGDVTATSTTGALMVTGAVSASAPGADVTLQSKGNLTIGAKVTATSGDITATSTIGALTVSQAVQANGAAVLISGDDLAINSTITATNGNATLQSTGGTLGTTANIQGTAVSLMSNGALTIGAQVTATAGDVTATSTNGALTVGSAVTASAPGGGVTVRSSGNLRLAAALTAGHMVSLTSTAGSVIESVGGAIAAPELLAVAGANVDLALGANAAGATGFAARAGGYVAFINNGAIELDQVGGTSGVTAGGTVAIRNAGGSITQTTGGIITAGSGLLLQSTTGSLTVDQANLIAGNIAVISNPGGNITLRNTGAINVGTVGPVGSIGAFSGITGGAGRTLSLTSLTGEITQGSGAGDRIIAGGLQVQTNNQNVTLANGANQFDSVGSSNLGNGRLTIFDSAGGLTLASPVIADGGVILTTLGAFVLPGSIVVANGDISLTTLTGSMSLGSTLSAVNGQVQLDAGGAGGTIAQTGGTITARTLIARAAGGVNLTQSGNDVASIAGASGTGAFVYRDASAITVGTLVSSTGQPVSGLTAVDQNITIAGGAGGIAINAPVNAGTGTVRLQASQGDIVQGAGSPITATTVLANALDGSVDFGGSTNTVTNIAGAALGSTFTLISSGPITITAVAGDGITAGAAGIVANNGDIRLVSGGAITLNGIVNAANGAPTGGGAAGNVTLVASGGGISQSGGAAIVGNDLLAVAGGSVDLPEAANFVVRLAGTSATGTFRYRNAAALVIDAVGGTSGVITNNQDIGIHAAGNLTLNQSVNALGSSGVSTAVVRLQATNGNLTESGAGVVIGGMLLANALGSGSVILTSPSNLVLNSGVVGAPGFVAGVAGGNFRFVNGNGLTVNSTGVAGDAGLGIIGATGVTAGSGRLVDLGVASGNLSIQGPITATAGMILYRRLAGAQAGNITIGGDGGNAGNGTGGAYLLIADLTGSSSLALTGLPESGPGSLAAPTGLFTTPTPPTTQTPSGLGSGTNLTGILTIGGLQGIDTVVYLAGGSGSSITSTAPGQFGILGVYAPEGAQVNLLSIVRAILNTTTRPIGPFGPFDPPAVSGPPDVVARDFVRKGGLPSLSQRFNNCVIAGPSCTTIFTQVANPPTASDDAFLGFAGSSLDDSSVVLVNQGNEEFIDESDEERRRRAGNRR